VFSSQTFRNAVSAGDSVTFLSQSLPLLSQFLRTDFLAVVQGEKGVWRVEAAEGARQNLPLEQLAESLDSGAPAITADWYVAPLDPRSGTGEMVCAYRRKVEMKGFMQLALETLATTLAHVRSREHERKRAQRLEAILEIAARWQETQEMEPLLTEMAMAA